MRKQTNAFAMQSGMIFGLIWCVSFLLLVSKDDALRALSTPLFLCTPFIGFFLAHKFKKDVQKDGPVSYLRGFGFSLLIYLYATAILAIVAYIYFQYFDHGAFIQRNLEILSQPEIKTILEHNNIKDIESALKELTPISISASIINMNVILAIPLALPTALFAITKNNNLQNS